jgi:hypothetical protein
LTEAQMRIEERLYPVPGGGSLRYQLAGYPVHNGDVVEILLATGWHPVRLEGMPEAILGYGLVLLTACGQSLPVVLPKSARFRWPA